LRACVCTNQPTNQPQPHSQDPPPPLPPRPHPQVESPGEDPLINGLYGAAYTEGLQALEAEKTEGELQAVVTLKHWLAYSIENYHGVTRTNVDVNVTAYDLADTYMPAWKASIVDGGALGVMCSYNMVNGRPTCANPALNKTLRDTWGFQG
jgi:beta-glucosidase-like glycosyl hydrolase